MSSLEENFEETLPNHWSDSYLKNTLEESFIIEVAIAQESFLDLLSEFFILPDLTISRSDVLTFLLVQSGVDITLLSTHVERPDFSDVTSKDEGFGIINFAAEAGLIDGYGDGTFKPSRITNRVEALKLVSTFYQEVPKELRGDELLARYNLEENPFSDVDLDEWYAPYVIAAYSNGIIQGYPDGTYKPSQSITHAEFLKIAILGKRTLWE
ncbi:S-layer homology domain-containing protein [Candidatus Peregrinibacteria bacterium]|nr:MAG: S-layer homology domain-containing protein [Candidatus Peregrinibacteria bacterium]